MSLDHARARELAAIAADHELEPADAVAMRRHLEGCATCRDFDNAVDADARAIAELPLLDPPARLRDRVLAIESSTPSNLESPASAGSARRGSAWIPSRRRPALVGIAAVLAVALIGGTLAWWSTTPDRPNLAVISPSPSPERSFAASPVPTTPTAPSDGGWVAAAELTALGRSGSLVPATASFRLASVDGTPPAELAQRLSVQPPVQLAIEAEPDGRAVRLTPAEPLVPGVVYHFTLMAPDGQELDSWAFQTEQPVAVVGTLPDDGQAEVSLDSGIEIYFNQDGIVDPAPHVTIEPAVEGRFEQHGRVLAFVPDRLRPGTVYTVTVRAGVATDGPAEPLPRNVVFSFETGVAESAATTTLEVQDEVVDAPTRETPVIGLWAFGDDVPQFIPVRVYRLAGLDAAVAAYQEVRTASWTRRSSHGLVETEGLPRIASFDAAVEQHDDQPGAWVTLPEPLPRGWYLIDLASSVRRFQAVLQVSDLAGFVAVSQTDTVVWANDIASGGPLANAMVDVAGSPLGRTDANGLVRGPSPAAALPAAESACSPRCASVVVVTSSDGRAVFLPTSARADPFGGSIDWAFWEQADPSHWVIFNTDRTRYRPTDRIDVWGLARRRVDGGVPTGVIVQLVAGEGDRDGAPLASVPLTPAANGAFSGSIPIGDVPAGWFLVELAIDGDVVDVSEIEVARIAKPAYRLDVTTGRRVYVKDDRIRVDVGASFYEGSPVPGVPLRLDGFVDRNLTTDVNGRATYRTVARTDYQEPDGLLTQINVTPARAEEGLVAGASREFVIFPSRRTITAGAVIDGDRVRVSGSVHALDIERIEQEIGDGAAPWAVDPKGAAVPGAVVTVTFVELTDVRTRTGTTYDFIEKRTVPTYSYDTRERTMTTVRVTTGSGGRFAEDVPATGGDHHYRVDVSVRDEDGLAVATSASAGNSGAVGSDEGTPYLLPTEPAGEQGAFGIGDSIDLTMRETGATDAQLRASRYLFYTAQAGIRDAVIQTSPRFVTTFEPWAPPNVDIQAVRFTGRRYVIGAGFSARFRSADRRIQVELSTPSARYAPGHEVTVDVRTLDAEGAPAPATVVLRAIDEKLFAIGGAEDGDALGELYAPLGPGLVNTNASHRTPHLNPIGGDTGGGGGDERSDFRDSLLFSSIETGTDGHGSVTFRLSDDLTSWRVGAVAMTGDLEAGQASIQVAVGLPFFVDASIAPEYLVADRPIIPVRTYGSALEDGTPVTVSVKSPALGFDSGPIRAMAFESVEVALPPLAVGVHDLTIEARTGSGDTALIDRLTRPLSVIDSRFTRPRTAFATDPGAGPVEGGPGLTTLVVSDASSGDILSLLVRIAETDGLRLDRSVASAGATAILADRLRPSSPPDASFDARSYQDLDGGLAILPAASSNLELSTLIALVAPETVNRSGLEQYLAHIAADTTETRERRTFALAGLAGLGRPVLQAIGAAAADPDLTVRERLMVGLGAAALGDIRTARTIAREIAEAHSEGDASQARLRVGSTADDITAGTALMAILAAATGMSSAPAFWAYVEANPSAETVHELHGLGYAERMLARLPAEAASFAYTLDGVRQTVELEPGRSYALTVTPEQRAALAFETISGSVGVASSWREPAAATAFAPDPDVTIQRTIRPAGQIGADDLVQVDLVVTFTRQAAGGCHTVTELAPSGLAVLADATAWLDPETDEPLNSEVVGPQERIGQRVVFCAQRREDHNSGVLRYFSRVVSPGTYAWESAVVESPLDPRRASLTPSGVIEIR